MIREEFLVQVRGHMVQAKAARRRAVEALAAHGDAPATCDVLADVVRLIDTEVTSLEERLFALMKLVAS